MAKRNKSGKQYRLQRIETTKDIQIGVRSTRRTHKDEHPVQIGKPFVYKKKVVKLIKHIQ